MQIGLWGCGTMGNSLARGLMSTDLARIPVVYDVLPEAAKAAAEEYGAQTVDSSEALLSHAGLDGVIVALPGYLHAPAVIQAAEAGVDVFVEKPMALDAATCRRMIAAAQEGGIQLMVGQVLRYYEPYQSILRWLAEGRFGNVFAASMWRVASSERVGGTYWRAKRAQSGGYLLEVGAHELDMLRCLLGRPETVHALSRKVLPRQNELLDYIAVQVRFAEGGAATYESGGGSRIPQYGFRFYFEGATLASDSAFDPKALQVYEDGRQEVSIAEDEFSTEHGVATEMRLWVTALRDGTAMPIPGEEGLATVALAEAAYRSAEMGVPVAYEVESE